MKPATADAAFLERRSLPAELLRPAGGPKLSVSKRGEGRWLAAAVRGEAFGPGCGSTIVIWLPLSAAAKAGICIFVTAFVMGILIGHTGDADSLHLQTVRKAWGLASRLTAPQSRVGCGHNPRLPMDSRRLRGFLAGAFFAV